MACLPITDSASVGMPYYSQGGGGGGGGAANLICSTLTTNSGDGTFGGTADINPQSDQFGIGSSKVGQINNWGNLADGVAYTIAALTTTAIDFQFNISTVNSVVPPITEEGTYLQIYSDSGNPQPVGGILSMGAQPDGTAYIAATTQGTPTVSTLFLVANQVKIFPEGDLVVSSINSAPATKAWFGTGEIGNLSAGVSEEILPFSFSSIDSFCATANYSYNTPPTSALSSLYTYPSTVSSFLVRGQDTFGYAWTAVGV